MARSASRPALLLLSMALAGVACTSILGDFTIDDGAGTTAAGGGGGVTASGGGNDGGGGNGGSGGSGGAPIDQCDMSGCNIGRADCFVCDGDCETTITNDPSHCGACGRSCEGGECVDGKCGPVLIASDTSEPEGIAVDATSVYWADDLVDGGSGAIIKSPILGQSAVELIPAQGSPLYVSTQGDYVYWTIRSMGYVRRAPKTGGDYLNIHGGGAPAGIVTDATYVYWTSDAAGSPGVYRKLLSAGSGGIPDNLAVGMDQDGAYGIAIDQSNVYWVTRVEATGAVRQVAKSGGAITTIASMQGNPRSVAVDATHVYWINEDTHDVRRALLSSIDNPQIIFEGNPMGLAPRDIAIDESGVYWTDASTGGIYRYDRPDGPVTKIASSPTSQTVALDAKRIYWTTLNGVYKMVK